MTETLVNLAEYRKKCLAYWHCDCGCMTHYVRNDGELECAYCEEIVNGAGFWRMPETDEALRLQRKDDVPTVTRIDMGDPDSCLRMILRRATVERTAAVIILQEDGHVTVWGQDFTPRGRRGWLRRKLEIARKLVVEL
jgi:hypothetical protein